MRPRFIVLIALLSTSSTLAAQPARGALWHDYDALESCTSVLANVFTRPTGERGTLSFHLKAMIHDSLASRPVEEALFMFGAEHAGESPFGQEPGLALVIDDSLRATYAGRHLRPFPSRRVRGGTLETVQFRVPAADLQRIARASTVRGTAGNAVFTLTARQIAVLRQLADHAALWRRPPLRRGEGLGLDCDSFQGPENAPRLGGSRPASRI